MQTSRFQLLKHNILQRIGVFIMLMCWLPIAGYADDIEPVSDQICKLSQINLINASGGILSVYRLARNKPTRLTNITRRQQVANGKTLTALASPLPGSGTGRAQGRIFMLVTLPNSTALIRITYLFAVDRTTNKCVANAGFSFLTQYNNPMVDIKLIPSVTAIPGRPAVPAKINVTFSPRILS